MKSRYLSIGLFAGLLAGLVSFDAGAGAAPVASQGTQPGSSWQFGKKWADESPLNKALAETLVTQQREIQLLRANAAEVNAAAKKHHRGYKVPADIKARHAKSWAKHGHHLKKMAKVTASDWDCRTLGLVPKIRNQSQCGSCWDFGGCGVCTMALIKAGQITLNSTNLSEQYILDCPGNNGGCNGDNSQTVTDWCKSHGIPGDEYGPYQASEGRCQLTSSMKLWKIDDSGFVAEQSGVAPTQEIKDAMVKYGPIQVNLDASGLDDGTGIVRGEGHSIDHAVMVVGWHDDASMREGGYWIMRNSWGEEWGEGGYRKVAYGAYDIGDGALWAVAVGGPVPPPAPPAPTPPAPPAPLTVTGTASGTIQVPSGSIWGGTKTITVTLPVTGTATPGPQADPQADPKKVGLSFDLFFALLALGRDLKAGGNETVVADFESLVTAIKTRTGVIDALEKLGTDVVAIGGNPQIWADLARIAVDIGVTIPTTSKMHAVQPKCCGQ